MSVMDQATSKVTATGTAGLKQYNQSGLLLGKRRRLHTPAGSCQGNGEKQPDQGKNPDGMERSLFSFADNQVFQQMWCDQAFIRLQGVFVAA